MSANQVQACIGGMTLLTRMSLPRWCHGCAFASNGPVLVRRLCYVDELARRHQAASGFGQTENL